MKRILTSCIVCVALISSFTGFSQNVEWSDLMKKKGYYPSFFYTGGKNFYSVVANGALGRSLGLKHYSDFMVDSEDNIEFKVDGKKSRYEGTRMVGKDIVVFMSQEQNDIQKLYYQRYDKSCKAIEPPVFLAEYPNEKGGRFSNFYVFQSENRQFLCVQYSIPGKKTDTEAFGYKIMNESLNITNEGEFEMPYTNAEATINTSYISGSGEYYIGLSIHPTKSNGKVIGNALSNYIICKMEGNDMTQLGLTDLETSLFDKGVAELNFVEDPNGLLVFTGLYGTGAETGVEGAFCMKINMDSKELVSEVFNKFEKDFITATWTDRQKKKAKKKEEKGKGTPEFYNYYVRELKCLPDGSVFVSMEQYYVTVHTYTDSKGNTRTTYTYHYNDVIVFKVGADNTFDWVQRIRKYQASSNDGGYILGIGGYTTDEDYVVYFNDNIENYDESGTYMVEDSEKINGTSASKNRNCVAKATINLETGELTRERFTSRAETDAYCIPKLFEDDEVNRTLLMYFQTRKKEKFGLLKY
jgi:hypothetical protein